MMPINRIIIVGFGSLASRVLTPLLAELITELRPIAKFVVKAVVDKAADRLEAAKEALEKSGLHEEDTQYLDALDKLNLVQICHETASLGGRVLVFDCSPTACHPDHAVFYLSLIGAA